MSVLIVRDERTCIEYVQTVASAIRMVCICTEMEHLNTKTNDSNFTPFLE